MKFLFEYKALTKCVLMLSLLSIASAKLAVDVRSRRAGNALKECFGDKLSNYMDGKLQVNEQTGALELTRNDVPAFCFTRWFTKKQTEPKATVMFHLGARFEEFRLNGELGIKLIGSTDQYQSGVTYKLMPQEGRILGQLMKDKWVLEVKKHIGLFERKVRFNRQIELERRQQNAKLDFENQHIGKSDKHTTLRKKLDVKPDHSSRKRNNKNRCAFYPQCTKMTKKIANQVDGKFYCKNCEKYSPQNEPVAADNVPARRIVNHINEELWTPPPSPEEQAAYANEVMNKLTERTKNGSKFYESVHDTKSLKKSNYVKWEVRDGNVEPQKKLSTWQLNWSAPHFAKMEFIRKDNNQNLGRFLFWRSEHSDEEFTKMYRLQEDGSTKKCMSMQLQIDVSEDGRSNGFPLRFVEKKDVSKDWTFDNIKSLDLLSRIEVNGQLYIGALKIQDSKITIQGLRTTTLSPTERLAKKIQTRRNGLRNAVDKKIQTRRNGLRNAVDARKRAARATQKALERDHKAAVDRKLEEFDVAASRLPENQYYQKGMTVRFRAGAHNKHCQTGTLDQYASDGKWKIKLTPQLLVCSKGCGYRLSYQDQNGENEGDACGKPNGCPKNGTLTYGNKRKFSTKHQNTFEKIPDALFETTNSAKARRDFQKKLADRKAAAAKEAAEKREQALQKIAEEAAAVKEAEEERQRAEMELEKRRTQTFKVGELVYLKTGLAAEINQTGRGNRYKIKPTKKVPKKFSIKRKVFKHNMELWKTNPIALVA